MEVGQELLMGSLLAILRLFGRRQKQLLHQGQIQIEQEGAVEKKKVTLAPLSVAGEFELIERQIGGTFDTYRLAEQRSNGSRVALHHEAICFSDTFKLVLDFKNQRIVQATRSLQHGATAAASSQDGNLMRLARCQVRFHGRPVGITNHD